MSEVRSIGSMGQLVDLEHYRSARELLELLIERTGVETFLEGEGRECLRIDPARLGDAVELTSGWLELRTGRRTGPATAALIHRTLRRMVIAALATHLVGTGY